MPIVLVDTGVWYAIFDTRDLVRTRDEVEQLAAQLQTMTVVVPWPTMYETLRTSFVRNRLALQLFERQLKGPNIVFVEDAPYRDAAFELALESSLNRGRPLSMVDCVIRLLLDDINTSVRYLATYNIGDFVDVCRDRHIEILGG